MSDKKPRNDTHSPTSASLVITIGAFACYQVSIGLVYSIPNSTEVAIQKMIEASQHMITMNNRGETGGMSPPLKRHVELEIKTLETAPRDADKLEGLLKAKRSQKEAMDSEVTQRLVKGERLKCSRLYCVW